MATLERAIEIAARAHTGHTDKLGAPYILHPLRLLQKMDTPEARIVAVLHDVIEDSDTTLEDLRQAGFVQEVLAGVECLTHERSESYTDYVVRCRANPIARQVKLADLQDNSQLDRSIMRPHKFDKDRNRLARYVLSYKFLSDQIEEDIYRNLMAEL